MFVLLHAKPHIPNPEGRWHLPDSGSVGAILNMIIFNPYWVCIITKLYNIKLYPTRAQDCCEAESENSAA